MEISNIYEQRAQRLMELGRYDDALKEWLLALGHETDNSVYQLNACICLINLNKYQEAKKLLFARIWSQHFDLAQLEYLRATVLHRLGNIHQAQIHAKRAVQADPGHNASYYGTWALILLDLASFKKAWKVVHQGLAIDAHNELCRLAEMLSLPFVSYYSEDWEQRLRSALMINAASPQFHAASGWLKLQVDEPNQAKQFFLTALQLDPSYSWARYGLVRATKECYVLYKVIVKIRRSKYVNLLIYFLIGLTAFLSVLLNENYAIPGPKSVLMLSAFWLFMLIGIPHLFSVFLGYRTQTAHLLTRRERTRAVLFGSLFGGLWWPVAIFNRYFLHELVGFQMQSQTLERGKLLYEQSRYEQALREFQQVLAQDPAETQAMYYQAHTLLHLDRTQEALTIADTILGQIPDEPVALELKATVLVQLKRLDEALVLIGEAIEQDPTEADFWATASTIHFEQKDFDKALTATEEGLRLEPDNLICRNIRTLSLNKLGRANEVASSVAETLAGDPDNAFSHASAGWALLEAGDHRQARVHFADALGLQPGLDWARTGMLEAIKAKNPFFRLFLRYTFWISQQKSQNQWLFIIGMGFVLRLMRTVNDPTGIVSVLRVVLILFVWLTWFIDPIFNVAMLFDREGRYLLTDRQRKRYPYVAGLLGLGLVLALVGYFARPLNFALLTTAVFLIGLTLLGLALPLSAWIEVDQPKNRRRMRWVFSAMALTVAGSAVLLLFSGFGMALFGLFVIEMVLFMLLRNFLLIHEDD